VADFVEEPLTFTAGKRWFEKKVNLPLGLNAAEIANNVPERTRNAAFYSAKVSSASVLDQLRETAQGIVDGEIGVGEGMKRLTDFLATEGYGIPTPGTKEDRNVAELPSTARLALILRTNVAAAHAIAQREFSENPYVREIYPNYEYRTAEDERVRPEHARLDGLVLPKDDPFWRTHYPPWDYNCRCIAVDAEGEVNGAATGFDAGDAEGQEADDAIQTGSVDNAGQMVNLTPNESGFVFRSEPDAAFEEPDFSAIADPALRAKVQELWTDRKG
jgi:SPP1 gp7 family putative phage head morphogenesis protein